MAFDIIFSKYVNQIIDDNIKMDNKLTSYKEFLIKEFRELYINVGVQPTFNINDPDIVNINPEEIINSNELKALNNININNNYITNLNKLEVLLNNNYNNIQIIKTSFNNIQKTINILNKTRNGLQKFNDGLSISTSLLKNLPLPSSVPPGIGLPMGTIISLTDIFDILKDKIQSNRGLLKEVPKIFKIIDFNLENTLYNINNINLLQDNILRYVLILKYHMNNNLDLNEELQNYSTLNLEFEDNNQEIIPQEFNFYKGFNIITEYNSNSKIPSKRLKAHNPVTNIILYNSDLYEGRIDSYSYTTSDNILIQEIKTVIDNYLG